MTATRNEHHHHMVADRKILNARSEFLHHARRLVAQHHRRRSRPVAVDHREVRMAQARRRNLY
jgi:hypothetical protein